MIADMNTHAPLTALARIRDLAAPLIFATLFIPTMLVTAFVLRWMLHVASPSVFSAVVVTLAGLCALGTWAIYAEVYDPDRIDVP